ncbi:histone-fold-containing protein [Gyrodon lividus]|nr:histone-fold-containing protein [Gyrodon lividus]
MAEEDNVLQDEVSRVHLTPPFHIEVEAIPEADGEIEHAGGDGSTTKKRGKKEGPVPREREPGKSILPFSRVQKIIKADKDLPIVAKDATFLISLATEEFIKRLSEACQKIAEREKRTTVQQKDIASIVRRVDEFLFLEEIIGLQEETGKRKRKAAKEDEPAQDGQESQPTFLDRFMQGPKTSEAEETEEVEGVIMNEDGAMYVG